MATLARLSVMMFIFFYAIGAWAVTLSTYLMSAPIKGGLNFTTTEVGWVYSTYAFGGMLAPALIGVLADRLFPAQRVLGVSGLVCAVLLALAGRWCETHFHRIDDAYRRAAGREIVDGRPALERYAASEGPTPEVRAALDRVSEDPQVRREVAETVPPLVALMLGYCVSLQIGLTLTTVIAMRNLPNPGWFSWPRLFGTVGWIAAGLTLGSGWVEPMSSGPLYLASGASALVGLYAFTLPATPPRGTGRTLAEIVGLPALKLFRDPSFGVFVGVAFTCTAMNQFYAVYAHRYLTDLGIPRPERVMTLGQVCETVCMLVLPLLHPHRRMKGLMVLGLAGWVLRGVVLTWGAVPAVLALGVPMHGWSYAFFFMVAATYLDREAPPHLRASAQGIITFVSGGIGVWVGNVFAGLVVEQQRLGTVIDWSDVWVVPLVGSSLALTVFVLLFRPPPDKSDS